MTRRRFSEREVLVTLMNQGTEIRCFRCHEPFVFAAISEHCIYDAEREHIHEIALDGPDTPENCAYSGKVCHTKITNGAPATSAGSSKNRIAKSRGTRAEKFAVEKKPLDEAAEIAATTRCRRCGEYQTDCQCQSKFSRPRSVRA